MKKLSTLMPTYKILFGLPFIIGDLHSVTNELIQLAHHRRGCTIIPASLNDIASAQDHTCMLDYQKIDHFTTDGMPLVWWAQKSGCMQASRVYGPDLFLHLLKKSQKQGFRHGFYGGNSKSLPSLIKNILNKFSIDIDYAYAPKFSENLSDDFVQLKKIQKINPHFLWIGLGGKKQVQLMAAWKDKLPNTVIIGVGAAFDFVSKSKRQAPHSMQRVGLEWLFRLYTEPKRLWKRYIIVIPLGLLQYFFHLLYGKIFPKNNSKDVKSIILLLTHFPENTHCDYVQQTKQYLSQQSRVIEIFSPQITQWTHTLAYIKYILSKEHNLILSKLAVPRILPLRKVPFLNQLDKQMGYQLIRFALQLIDKKKNHSIWTFYPQLADLASVLSAEKQKLILDLVDIHLKQVTPSSLTYTKQLKWMLRHATTVTAISHSAVRYAQNIHMREISLVPQGFDLKSMPRIKPKKMYLAGYIGSFNGRVDTKLLLTVIKQLPDHRFLIIGPLENDSHSPQLNKKEVFEILTAPNVTWIKTLTRTKAMQQLACCYTGIIPYKTDLLFNKTAYPMKVLEYFWLGLSVVSTRIPELQRHKDHLRMSNDAAQWIQFLLDSKKKKFSAKEMAAQKKIAEDQTWDKKIDMIKTIAQI